MSVLVVTGTGTGVGKTVVTAAIAALARGAGRRVAVLKPAQTGVAYDAPGDVEEIVRLAGEVTTRELRRYPEPLPPHAAARRSGIAPVGPAEAAAAATRLADTHDLVLIDGTGGLLLRFTPDGATLADVAWALGAPVLLVAGAGGTGTVDATALTAEVATTRGLHVIGVVIGSWPSPAGVVARSGLRDVPVAAGAPLLGVLPAGMGRLSRAGFLQEARRGLSPWFDGDFDADCFEKETFGE
ncbi:dethiobiotin synthase [Amycolatopsis taiwanensis]|uniref:dethiobiotin synthase n=1 Tax=Amycolatopsis taiwanensis TaxID=342230 RepID=UPI000487E2AE|nr:dethiobiotin synthase [Amycolatopsis taiwanensis]